MHYNNLQKHMALDTLQIHELIRDQVPFKDWPAEQQKVLAASILPPNPRQDDNGRWTLDGKAALNLLRHLIKNAHFLRVPEALRDVHAKITDQETASLYTKAASVRTELIFVTPPWCLEALLT